MHKKPKRDRRLVRLECRLIWDVRFYDSIAKIHPHDDVAKTEQMRFKRRLRILQQGIPASLRKPVNVHELELWRALERLSHPQFIISTKGAPEPEINMNDVIQVDPVIVAEHKSKPK